ncbi:hypothetical protein Tco_1100120 [Tanacetum coccineum]
MVPTDGTRLVLFAKGSTQLAGIDLDDTFKSVSDVAPISDSNINPEKPSRPLTVSHLTLPDISYAVRQFCPFSMHDPQRRKDRKGEKLISLLSKRTLLYVVAPCPNGLQLYSSNDVIISGLPQMRTGRGFVPYSSSQYGKQSTSLTSKLDVYSLIIVLRSE